MSVRVAVRGSARARAISIDKCSARKKFDYLVSISSKNMQHIIIEMITKLRLPIGML